MLTCSLSSYSLQVVTNQSDCRVHPEREQIMGIAQKVARNFSDAVRSRGQSYFVKGRVTLMTARAGEVVARVRGTSKYRVRVRLRGSKLLASCTCPYFNPQGEPCKHLWATLLLAEARGLLQSPPVFPVHLVTESPRHTSHEGLPETRRSRRDWTDSPQGSEIWIWVWK